MNLVEMDTLVPHTEPAGNRTFTCGAEAKKNSPTLRRQIAQLFFASTLALLTYLFISHFVLQSVQVVGVSMMPTLHNADRYFLNRWMYLFHPPHRGDVVVLKDPTDGEYAVKRVIAVAGDSICLRHGQVYVNGQKLQESYLPAGTETFTCTSRSEGVIGCGKDRFFVMGDNRGNSFDSRFYGPVPRGNILGVITP